MGELRPPEAYNVRLAAAAAAKARIACCVVEGIPSMIFDLAFCQTVT